MMNTMMKQSAIRKFVSNNMSCEPKLMNAKVNVVQTTTNTTTTPKAVPTIKPITNDFKIFSQKKEINPTELLRSMKYNVGKSPSKLSFNNNYNNNTLYNSNNNNNNRKNSNSNVNKSNDNGVNAIQMTNPIINNTQLKSYDTILKPAENTNNNLKAIKKEEIDKQAIQKKEIEEMRKRNVSTSKEGNKKQMYYKPNNPMSKPIERFAFEQKYQSNNEQKVIPIIKQDDNNINTTNYNNKDFELKKNILLQAKNQKYMFDQEEDLNSPNETNALNIKDKSNIEHDVNIPTNEVKTNKTSFEKYKINPKQPQQPLQQLLPNKQQVQPKSSSISNEVNAINNHKEVIQPQFQSQLQSQAYQSSINQKELEQLKRRNKQLEKENEDLFKEIDIAQKKCQESLQQIKEIKAEGNETSNALNQANILNNTLEQKIKTMEEDIELLNEELSTKDLEFQVANKQYADYKASIKSIERASHQLIDYSALPQSDQSNKIIELEKIISELSHSLTTSCQERDYSLDYYKAQIDELNSKLKSSQRTINTIPVKDDLIKQRTAKLKEYESIIEELKTQMRSLSPNNDVYEQVIIEKDDLELKYAELKSEYNKLKEDFLSDEELIREHESMNKLSEKVEMNNKNELLKAYDYIKQLEDKLEDAEENEKALRNRIIQLKTSDSSQINDIDIPKAKINTKDMVNDSNANNPQVTSSSIKSKIEMFERQSVLLKIEQIDNDDLKLRNQMIKSIIPKRVFDQASLDSFDQLLTLRTIRKKTSEIIFNILKNNILKDSNLILKSETNSLEINSMKKIVEFYCFIVLLLIEYNTSIFTIEINQSKNLDSIPSEEFNKVYMNIIAGKQFIDLIIQLIKDDSLSIQYYQQLEGLNEIVTKVNDILSKGNISLNSNHNLVKYYKLLLLFSANIIKAYKSGKNGLVIKESNSTSPLELSMKMLVKWFTNINKCLKKVTYVSFDYALYENIHDSLDSSLSIYIQIDKIFQAKEYDILNKDVYTNTWQTNLDHYISLSDKLSTIISSSIEKIEKGNNAKINSSNKGNNIELAFLPQNEWNAKTKEINMELSSFANTKEELESASRKLKEERIENAQLKSQLEDLSRSKQYNDALLTEMNTKASKVTQLELSISDYQKKLKTYVHVIDDLIHKEERYQLEINTFQNKSKEMTKELSAFQAGRRYVKPVKTQGNANNYGDDNSNIDNDYYFNYSNIAYSDLIQNQKSLKETIMKEKMGKLINNDNSFINQYIQSEIVSTNEKELLSKVNKEIYCLNEDYNKLRIALPNVNDLSITKSRLKDKEDNKGLINHIRLDYLQNASKILYTVIGNCMDDNAFKYYLHNDIEKDLTKYNDNNKAAAVGKIIIANNNSREKIGSSSVLLTEDSLKLLNHTFIH